MFQVLIRSDNTTIVTENQRIMQNSKLVDTLEIVVGKEYNGLSMAECTAYLEYLTPINHKIGQVVLEIADENYENDYLLYKMKIDTNLTNEVGQVQFRVHFIQVEMNEEGKVITPVRQTDSFIMTVIPISDWMTLPDNLLSDLDQRLIVMQQTNKAMADLQNTLAEDKLDDIKLDVEAGTLYGTSGGVRKGTGVKISDLGDAIADDTKDGMVVINTYDVKDEE
jgi:hypothetical protein